MGQTVRFFGVLPLQIGIHIYGLAHLLALAILIVLSFIFKDDTATLVFLILTQIGVCAPALLNYIPALVRQFSFFWRQNLQLTAWFQVFLSLVLYAGYYIYLAMARDDSPLVALFFIFITLTAFQIYLAIVCGQFVTEYLETGDNRLLEDQKQKQMF